MLKSESRFYVAVDLVNVTMFFVLLGQALVLDGPRWMGWVDGTIGLGCVAAVIFRRIGLRADNDMRAMEARWNTK